MNRTLRPIDAERINRRRNIDSLARMLLGNCLLGEMLDRIRWIKWYLIRADRAKGRDSLGLLFKRLLAGNLKMKKKFGIVNFFFFFF